MRTSVSTEVYGQFNPKASFKPPKYDKTPELRAKIQKRLEEAFMFSSLNKEEFEIVIDAMQSVKVEKGKDIIKEGDDGDNLYVVESGVLECFKLFVTFYVKFQKGNTEPTMLKTYSPGESFGELALLYNAPRAATITAKDNVELWCLDRNTFNHIVKDAAAKKREIYDEFLSKVKILQNMDSYERQKLADAIKEENYKVGDFVI